jgi:hypothetical protein
MSGYTLAGCARDRRSVSSRDWRAAITPALWHIGFLMIEGIGCGCRAGMGADLETEPRMSFKRKQPPDTRGVDHRGRAPGRRGYT